MSSEMMTCPTCGSAMAANARFCPQCGYQNEAIAASMETVAISPPAHGGDPLSGGAPTVNIGGSAGYAPYAAPPELSSASQPLEQARVEPPTAPQAQPPAPAAPAYTPYVPPPQQTQPTPAYAPSPSQQTQPAPVYAPPPAQRNAQMQEMQLSAPRSQPPVPAYGSYSPQPLNYQYQPQVGVAGTPQRDPTVALLLELIGYVWVLGLGHLYGGRIGRGIALMVFWWAYWGIVAFMAITLIGIPVACIMAVAWP